MLCTPFRVHQFVHGVKNRRHGKILVIGHGRWNGTGGIKPFAPGYPLAFELVPIMFAPPVLLRVKKQDKCDQTGKDEEEPFEIVPGTQPADEANREEKGKHDANRKEQRKGGQPQIVRQQGWHKSGGKNGDKNNGRKYNEPDRECAWAYPCFILGLF